MAYGIQTTWLCPKNGVHFTLPLYFRKDVHLMNEKTISITEKVIANTLYIIEPAISNTAKETAYDKLKRMILNGTEISEHNTNS